ncbi:MAG TPA: DUF397 domain-containing protein [Streptomyces sp.]|nr:DUF397 domain-containing protein [Streptomyces sp.]
MSTSRPTVYDSGLTGARWRRSSHSGGSNDCVEIADLGARVAIRDSKDPRQCLLLFERRAVAAFLTTLTTLTALTDLAD